jgi:hypothetical protein
LLDMQLIPLEPNLLSMSRGLCQQEDHLFLKDFQKRITVAVFRKSSKEVFPFDANVGIFKHLEERVAKPLGKFMEWHKGFETFR